MTRMAEPTKRNMQSNLILPKLSLNIKKATIITNTVFKEIKAPTIPPFMPASSAQSNAIVDD